MSLANEEDGCSKDDSLYPAKGNDQDRISDLSQVF
jgi:hypothetical protein